MNFEQTFENVKREIEFELFREKLIHYSKVSVTKRKMISILSNFIDIIEDDEEDECSAFGNFYYTNVNYHNISDMSVIEDVTTSLVRLARKNDNVKRVIQLIIETCDKI